MAVWPARQAFGPSGGELFPLNRSGNKTTCSKSDASAGEPAEASLFLLPLESQLLNKCRDRCMNIFRPFTGQENAHAMDYEFSRCCRREQMAY
jgi:hypothetical protein